jgi:hypothetical protein
LNLGLALLQVGLALFQVEVALLQVGMVMSFVVVVGLVVALMMEELVQRSSYHQVAN